MPAAQVRPRLPERMVAMEGQPGSLPGLCEDGDDSCIFGGGDADLRRRTPTRGCRPWRRCVPTGWGRFDGGGRGLAPQDSHEGLPALAALRPYRMWLVRWGERGLAPQDSHEGLPALAALRPYRMWPVRWGGRGLAPQDSHEGLPALAALRPYITTAFSTMGSGLNH